MTENANPPTKRRLLGAIVALVGGALSGLGTNAAARAAAPTELEAVKQEIAALRKDITGALDRLRTVELAQADERGFQRGMQLQQTKSRDQ